MTEATRWATRPAPEGDRDESPGHRARPLEEPSEETPDSSVPDTKSPQTNDLKERREACDRLRSRLKPEQDVHLRDLLIKKDKEIARQDEEIETLKKNMICLSTLFSKDIETTHKEIDCLKEDLDITEGELTICQTSEKEWIGRALQLKFILDEIKKLRALPKDHAEWVDPMVEQVEFPEVSINVKDEFIPTAQTDNIDWTDDEEQAEQPDDDEEDDEGYEYLRRFGGRVEHIIEMIDCPEEFSEEYLWRFGETAHQCLVEFLSRSRIDRARALSSVPGAGALFSRHPRAILEKSAKTIQRYWRGYRTRVVLPRIAMQASEDKQDLMRSAKTIQRYWRGYSMRVLLKIRNLVVSHSLSQRHARALASLFQQQRLRSRRSEREAGGFMSEA